MKAGVSISSRQSNIRGGYITIEIKERNSRQKVCEVEMSYEEFSKCITGLSSCEGEFQFLATPAVAENFGKQKVTETVFCDRSWDKDLQFRIMMEDFEKKYKDDGWMVWDDGLNTQQRGQHHAYIIYRYEN